MPRTTRILLPVLALSLAAGASRAALAADGASSDPATWGYLALVPLPFFLVGLVGTLRAGDRPDAAVRVAGTLLGLGLGGFVDGILFHQLLQWHGMVSSWVPPVDVPSMRVNMLWDGLFHALTWTVTVLGVAQLWRACNKRGVQRRTATLVGGMLGGWGMFNVIEGLVDHQFLGVHHVHPGIGQLAWDLGFLLVGALLILFGRALTEEDREF